MNMADTTRPIELDETTAGDDPLLLFQRWFAEAKQAGIQMPEAMTLTTATGEGRPSARVVLLKQVDEAGFVFYTNYNSRKGKELDSNPFASLVFYWGPLEYQVRVEGTVTRNSPSDADAYFQTRPRESQIGAIASAQSEVIDGREALEARVKELMTRYEGSVIERPPHWGGYLVKPTRMEFWKGRVGRLHDRLLYERQADDSWLISRLSP